jgi:hypothetical protein
MEGFLYSIFVVNLDKINITMIQVSLPKKIIDLMKGTVLTLLQTTLGRCEKWRMFCLSYDLKFDKAKAKTIKFHRQRNNNCSGKNLSFI